ncbi:MAG: hypothetical protein SV966_07095 [Actinomycetota bacterium]|nr:hypothetical protein [Actinomycetota bacterium]
MTAPHVTRLTEADWQQFAVARAVYEGVGFRISATTVGPRHELAMSLSV